jgi:hypothetical protein
MGKKKPATTTSETKTTLAFAEKPRTEEQNRVSEASQLDSSAIPQIKATYAGARTNLAESFNNPLGAHTTQATRDATIRAGDQDLAQQEAIAVGNQATQDQNAKFGRLAVAAGGVDPVAYNSNVKQTAMHEPAQQGIFGSILGAGAQIGSAALM